MQRWLFAEGILLVVVASVEHPEMPGFDVCMPALLVDLGKYLLDSVDLLLFLLLEIYLFSVCSVRCVHQYFY